MNLFSKSKKATDPPSDLESLSVIALANSAAGVESIFSSLIKYQYKTKLVYDVPAFIEALKDFDPDIILISLNLLNTDTVKVITVLQSLDLPVIVFGEEEDEETCLRLLSTDLHHVIIPPVTFDSFMERVEFLAMEKELLPDDSEPSSKEGAGSSKTNWGKVIQLLKERLLSQGTVIIKTDANKALGNVVLQETPLTEALLEELVPVQDDELQVGKKLGSDIFISMPLNHKCILYLRSGCVLTKENMDRLRRYDKSRVMKKN